VKILVLGGAGFIGVQLTRRLKEAGHAVTIVDDFSRGRHDPDLAALDVPVLSADLTEPASWESLPRGWDQVYMLVAVVGVENVESAPARVIRTNTLSLLNLLDWIRPGERLFFASTSETYADGVTNGLVPVPTPEDVPLLIDDVSARRSTYGISKLHGEAAVIHTARAKGVPFVIGRFHNVYGPRMGTAHVIPQLFLRAMRREDPFRVYGMEQSRAFCHIDDATAAMTQLMATDAAAGEIVNIGNDAETKIADLAELILRLADFKPTLENRPAPPGSVGRRCPDLAKLRALTGYEPAVSLEDGLRHTVAWYEAHDGEHEKLTG
jgi:nucleoside-diphosphate-sugar epimerase